MVFAAPFWFYKFDPWAYGPPVIGQRDIAKEDAPSLLVVFISLCVGAVGRLGF
jgi:hypothetical protein